MGKTKVPKHGKLLELSHIISYLRNMRSRNVSYKSFGHKTKISCYTWNAIDIYTRDHVVLLDKSTTSGMATDKSLFLRLPPLRRQQRELRIKVNISRIRRDSKWNRLDRRGESKGPDGNRTRNISRGGEHNIEETFLTLGNVPQQALFGDQPIRGHATQDNGLTYSKLDCRSYALSLDDRGGKATTQIYIATDKPVFLLNLEAHTTTTEKIRRYTQLQTHLAISNTRLTDTSPGHRHSRQGHFRKRLDLGNLAMSKDQMRTLHDIDGRTIGDDIQSCSYFIAAQVQSRSTRPQIQTDIPARDSLDGGRQIPAPLYIPIHVNRPRTHSTRLRSQIKSHQSIARSDNIGLRSSHRHRSSCKIRDNLHAKASHGCSKVRRHPIGKPMHPDENRSSRRRGRTTDRSNKRSPRRRSSKGRRYRGRHIYRWTERTLCPRIRTDLRNRR